MAVDYDAQRAAVLGALTGVPQRVMAISNASGIERVETSRRLKELLDSGLARAKWTSTGARLYALKASEPPKTRRLPVVQEEHWRPKTRGDCKSVPRPCPHAGCRHHLYLDISSEGWLRINKSVSEPGEMVVSCSLDVADRGHQMLLDEIGELMGVTKERVRQLEFSALRKLEHNARVLREFAHD